ncbi:MAG TPA: hypothetical protein VM888_09815, partial [Chitinophagaceae bacterium]|nr:hypothetical protein [Chitinophagaceae bacterium]
MIDNLRLEKELYLELLENQPVPVLYFVPLFSKGINKHEIIDFEVQYCNKEAYHFTNFNQENLLGQPLSLIPIPTETGKQRIFDELKKVYLTGEQIEYSYFNSILHRHFTVLRKKVGDGVFTIALNRNAEVKMLAERDVEADFTNSIMNTAINAVFVCQAIRDDEGIIIDLLMQRVNSAFTQIVMRTEVEVIGNTYLNLFPSSKHQGAFDINCSVINSGVSLRKEMFYSGEGLDA